MITGRVGQFCAAAGAVAETSAAKPEINLTLVIIRSVRSFADAAFLAASQCMVTRSGQRGTVNKDTSISGAAKGILLRFLGRRLQDRGGCCIPCIGQVQSS
jgi:hypothetical protein